MRKTDERREKEVKEVESEFELIIAKHSPSITPVSPVILATLRGKRR